MSFPKSLEDNCSCNFGTLNGSIGSYKNEFTVQKKRNAKVELKTKPKPCGKMCYIKVLISI